MPDDILWTVKKALEELDVAAKADNIGRCLSATQHIEANDVFWLRALVTRCEQAEHDLFHAQKDTAAARAVLETATQASGTTWVGAQTGRIRRLVAVDDASWQAWKNRPR